MAIIIIVRVLDINFAAHRPQKNKIPCERCYTINLIWSFLELYGEQLYLTLYILKRFLREINKTHNTIALYT